MDLSHAQLRRLFDELGFWYCSKEQYAEVLSTMERVNRRKYTPEELRELIKQVAYTPTSRGFFIAAISVSLDGTAYAGEHDIHLGGDIKEFLTSKRIVSHTETTGLGLDSILVEICVNCVESGEQFPEKSTEERRAARRNSRLTVPERIKKLKAMIDG